MAHPKESQSPPTNPKPNIDHSLERPNTQETSPHQPTTEHGKKQTRYVLRG